MSIAAIDKHTVRQICVSQVVTSAGGAVKELVENALDAGATEVTVRTVGWGADEIVVEDNGKGIPAKDFDRIVAQHATSKIRGFGDLESGVGTFGFRGEALSALCGLGELTVETRHSSAARGTRLEYNHDQSVRKQTEMGRGVGTTVRVKRLFTTLPVRRKELERNAKKEYQQLLRIVQEYCVASTGVKIKLYHAAAPNKANSILAASSGRSLIENIHEIFGIGVTRHLMRAHLKLSSGMVITGFVSKCIRGCGRVKPDARFLYIRSRPVDIAAFGTKINAAYRILNPKEKPMFFLNISGSASDFDVNITPDKRTVLVKGGDDMCEFVQEGFRRLWEQPAAQADSSSALMRQIKWFDERGDDPENEAGGREEGTKASDERGGGSTAAAATTAGKVAPPSPSPMMVPQVDLTVDDAPEANGGAASPIPATPPATPQQSAERFLNLRNSWRGDGAQTSQGATPSPPPQSAVRVPAPTPPPRVEMGGDVEQSSAPVFKPPASSAARSDASSDASSDSDVIHGGGASQKKRSKNQQQQPTRVSLKRARTDDDESSDGDAPLPSSKRVRGSGTPPVTPPPQPVGTAGPDVDGERARTLSGRLDFDVPETTQDAARARTPRPAGESALRNDDGGDADDDIVSNGVEEVAAPPPRQAAADVFRALRRGAYTPGSAGKLVAAATSSGSESTRPQASLKRTAVALDGSDDDVPAQRKAKQNGKRPKKSASKKNKVERVAEAPINIRFRTYTLDGTGRPIGRTTPLPEAPDGLRLPQGLVAENSNRGDGSSCADPDTSLPDYGSGSAVVVDGGAGGGDGATRDTSMDQHVDVSIAGIAAAIERQREAPAKKALSDDADGDAAREWCAYFGKTAACEEQLASRVSKDDFKKMRIIGQFNKGFVVAALERDLFLIDQHASDEKYNYERLKAAYQVTPQPLVQPRPLCIPTGDALLLRDREVVFRQNGFRFKYNDEATDPGKRVFVTAVPVSYNTTFTDHDIQEIIAILKEVPGAKTARPTRTTAMLASRACRGSVMIGTALDLRGMTRIVRHMGVMRNPWSCPHGRPTLRHLTTVTHAPLAGSAHGMTTQPQAFAPVLSPAEPPTSDFSPAAPRLVEDAGNV